MLDRQALTQQLLDHLETVPEMPEYVAGEPEISERFDPYQMVGEWIALRQEVKQQNKLMQSSQQNLQQNLQQVLSQIQTPEPTQPPPVKQEDDSGLVKDLLVVMDSLDNAIEHSDSQINSSAEISMPRERGSGFWDQVLSFFEVDEPSTPERLEDGLVETLTSQKTGIEMIRRSLLEVLQKRQVKPMNAVGQPFDPQCMYAIAQQSSDTEPTNTVIQEVVKGYWKGDRILREAQVIVASKA
jgi:molecular chaperone GrpE